jgi:hypothetical protein
MNKIPKKYKNLLFQEILSRGFSIADFKGADRYIDELSSWRPYGFVIQYKDTYLRFYLTNEHDYSQFQWSYTYFTHRYIDRLWEPTTFDNILKSLNHWLTNVQKYQEEEDTIDLWEHINDYKDFISFPTSSVSDYKPFTGAEIVQVRLGVSEFQKLLVENYNPTADQLREINMRLDHLVDAVDHALRWDWKALALSTFIEISIALTLDTEAGRELYKLFQQAFQHVVFLLQSPH